MHLMNKFTFHWLLWITCACHILHHQADVQAQGKILILMYVVLHMKKKTGCLLKFISKDASQFHLLYFKTKPILRTITSDTMRKISSLQELSVLRRTWANCKSHRPGTIIWSLFPFKESHQWQKCLSLPFPFNGHNLSQVPPTGLYRADVRMHYWAS